MGEESDGAVRITIGEATALESFDRLQVVLISRKRIKRHHMALKFQVGENYMMRILNIAKPQYIRRKTAHVASIYR